VLVTFIAPEPLIVSIEFGLVADVLWPILADRDFNALLGETLAKRGALDDTREFLGGVHSEGVREATGQHWTLSGRNDSVGTRAGTNVGEAHFQPKRSVQQEQREVRESYLNVPSVRTERSCRTNQKPVLPSGSLRRKALTVFMPIRLRV
jgi:hypothetical protein